MYKDQLIRRFIAGVMLLLFAVSITPKQLFHDVITGHKHSYVKTGDALNVHTPKSNFKCSWHSDAVESPFTDQPGFEVDGPSPLYSSDYSYYTCSYFSAEHFFSPLRGPPSLI